MKLMDTEFVIYDKRLFSISRVKPPVLASLVLWSTLSGGIVGGLIGFVGAMALWFLL